MKASRRHRPLFVIATVLFVALVIEASARVLEVLSRHVHGEPIMLRSAILRQQSDRIAMMLDTTRRVRDVLDPLLGWRYRSGYGAANDQINLQGLRARHLYDTLPDAGVLRIAAFGDSFVYGNEVGDADAWCSVLESTVRDLDVLNYGVGGYGLDQAFLRFQHEGTVFHPDIVLIVLAPDDLRRVVNVYRPFISTLEFPLSKPRFVIGANGRLTLIPTPLPTRESYVRLMKHPGDVRALGALDAWYPRVVYENPLYDHLGSVRVATTIWRWLDRRFVDPKRLIRDGVFNSRSPAFAVQVAIMEAFATAVRRAGATPIVLLLPDRASLVSLHHGGPTVYTTLQDSLVSRGLVVWDGADAFRGLQAPIDSLYAPLLHYSRLGNRLLARWLVSRIDPMRADHAAPLGAVARPDQSRPSGG